MATVSPYQVTAGRGVPKQLAEEGIKPKLPALGPVMSSVAPVLKQPVAGPTAIPMQQLPAPQPQPTDRDRDFRYGASNGNGAFGGLARTGQPGAPTSDPRQKSGGQAQAGTNPAAPQVPMGFGGINFTPYGPGNTLRNQQITPQGTGGVGGQMSPEASRARELALADLEGLGGPDRGQIASDTLQRLIRDTNPAYEQELRGVGQKAAALGRLGSGMTTSDLGDVTQRRNQAIVSEAGRLSGEAAGASLADRLDVFGARSGAASRFQGDDLAREDQSFRQGQGIRDEYRGERDFQDYMANNATNDQVRQLLLEDQLLNSSFGRDQQRLGTLSTGFGNVPTDAYGNAADNYANQAQGNLDTVAQLAALYGNRRTA